MASTRLKASREEIFDALQGDLTASHRFVLDELMHPVEEIEARIAVIWAWRLWPDRIKSNPGPSTSALLGAFGLR